MNFSPRKIAFTERAGSRPLALPALGLLIALILIDCPAEADTQSELGGGTRVENVRIDAASPGKDAQLRLLIVNDGQITLHLLGASSAEAEGSKIDTEIDPGKRISLDILTIPSNEALNLETFHQRLFLTGIKRQLVAGQELEIRLHFLEGVLNTVAHVH